MAHRACDLTVLRSPRATGVHRTSNRQVSGQIASKFVSLREAARTVGYHQDAAQLDFGGRAAPRAWACEGARAVAGEPRTVS